LGVVEGTPGDRTEPVLEEIRRKLLGREEEWVKLAANRVQPDHREKHQHILMYKNKIITSSANT